MGRKKALDKNVKLYDNNELISDNNILTNKFANHFSTNIQQKINICFGSNLSLPCTTSIYRENEIFFPPITNEEVNETIIHLKNKKSVGFDNLTADLLKTIREDVVDQLTYLFNISIEQGHFPNTLKLAIVIPVHKNGAVEDIENYRQISLLSVVSKLFERIIYNRIVSFCEINKILTISQHGFRAGKSTETACCHLLEHVYKSLDTGKYVISLLFDLSKAFDTIDKNLLEKKLSSMGIRGTILTWIVSYMENRSIKVKLNGINSNEHDVKIGVPQGSVLGPLLFLLYINNLPNYLTAGHATIFADDLTVTLSAGSLEELQAQTNLTMQEISSWSQRDRLILNDSKTVFIHFHIQKPLPHDAIIYDGITISKTTKLLGTYLDSKLSWDEHIHFVCGQLNKAYFAILQMRNSLDQFGLLNIYYALAYSHISYNIVCWGSAKDKDRVFICQKRLIRLIYKLNYNESCREIFKKEKILTTPSIFIYKCLMYARKNMSLFTKRDECHTYNTRHAELLDIPRHNTTKFKHSPHYNCITLYNSLPENIRKIKIYKNYKTETKNLLLKGGFYSIQDFLNREPVGI